MMYTCRGEEYIYTLQQKFNAGVRFSLTPLWVRPGGRTEAVLRTPPLVIGIAILNRISHMVTDEFLQTTLLLKPFIFTDNLLLSVLQY